MGALASGLRTHANPLVSLFSVYRAPQLTRDERDVPRTSRGQMPRIEYPSSWPCIWRQERQEKRHG